MTKSLSEDFSWFAKELKDLKAVVPEASEDHKKLEEELGDYKISVDYTDINKVALTYEQKSTKDAQIFIIEKKGTTFTISTSSQEWMVIPPFETGDKGILVWKINEVLDKSFGSEREEFPGTMVALATILLPSN